MNALILFAAAGLFAAGATAGIISVATLAIRREEKHLTLTSAATDRLTRAGRWLNGVGVRAPCRPDALPYPLEFKLLEEDWDGVLTPDLTRAGDYQVNVGGRLYPATVHLRPPFDPAGDRVKGRYQNLFFRTILGSCRGAAGSGTGGSRRAGAVIVVDPGPVVDPGYWDALDPPRSPDPPRKCDESG